jgi:ABC-2 type transport system permease protein
MKNFFIVLKFELLNLIKKKPFFISTAIISLILIIGLSVPTITGSFGAPVFNKDKSQTKTVDKINYGILIENDSVELSDLKIQLSNTNIITANSKSNLKDLVTSDEVTAGFIIKNPTKYEYLVKNTGIDDNNTHQMNTALLNIYRDKNLQAEGIDTGIVNEIYNVSVEHDMEVLGKDSMKNYIYTYILIFGLYFVIIIYGQLIATSIASEKSNRTMEILITSTNTKSLIFGKVIAGALAGILQFELILLVAGVSYKLNANAWNHMLDFIFNIPSNVLLTFSIFGILGYFFYLFSYGIIGALVSRTEDVGASATPVTIIFIIAFFVSMFSMQAPDSLLLKIASFVPLSSFMAMFVRVSMGNVSALHVAISLVLLAGTTISIGVLGAKIYQLGTLMYGNPVKLRTAIKLLKQK